jgi:two-component system chemotaxis response regulator CheB
MSKIRVLVVDDSAFFRKRIVEILNADPRIEVIGMAADGREAIDQNRRLKPDVITMDVEMPQMNGIEAVRQIMATQPTPVLMFSSLTYDGAKATLDALDAGALDFLPKQFESLTRGADSGQHQLCSRVVAIARKSGAPLRSPTARPAPTPSPVTAARPMASATPAAPSTEPGRRLSRSDTAPGSLRDHCLVIGASTGGPIALQQVISVLPANFPAPIVVAIHMPANFTKAFAERLNSLSKLEVREAVEGDQPRPGLVLVAPGGMQLVFEARGSQNQLHVRESTAEQIYRPSVDVLFGSASRACGAKVLALVLTGMGADGLQGGRLLKQGGGKLWSQNAATCVVYGMPQAVESAGLSDRVLPLNEIGKAISDAFL